MSAVRPSPHQEHSLALCEQDLPRDVILPQIMSTETGVGSPKRLPVSLFPATKTPRSRTGSGVFPHGPAALLCRQTWGGNLKGRAGGNPSICSLSKGEVTRLCWGG